MELLPKSATQPNKPGGFIFPKPKDIRKSFRPHDASTVLFEPNRKVGKNSISSMLPTLTQDVLKLGRCTNPQLRATVIKALRRAKFDWPTICKITGHKSIQTLIENYDPSLDTPDHANISVAIGTAPNLKRGIEFQLFSSAMSRRPNFTDVDYNEPSQMVPNLVNKTKKTEDSCENVDNHIDDNFLNNSLFKYESEKEDLNVNDTKEKEVEDEEKEKEGFNLKYIMITHERNFQARRKLLSSKGEKMSFKETENWRICQMKCQQNGE